MTQVMVWRWDCGAGVLVGAYATSVPCYPLTSDNDRHHGTAGFLPGLSDTSWKLLKGQSAAQ